MSKGEYKQIEEKMKKTISVLKQELSRLRAGRANPAILDKVTVDYYGAPTPINQLANISIPEARLIVIQPWDVNTLKDIEKAIQKSDIGIVLKFVSIPPSHRTFTKNCPHLSASSLIESWACFFVPTNRISSPFIAVSLINK